MSRILQERLRTLRVADVLARQVTTVSIHDTMPQAAAALCRRQISGAPVVDETGRCVGILSAADFVRREAARGDDTSCIGTRSGGTAVGEASLNLPELDADTVRDHMASGVQSVSADATLMQAARVMCAAHVHRLPVLDAGGAPVGMMTSLDIVAALVQAMEEAG
jgi:CBS-domain-containing membrane protein